MLGRLVGVTVLYAVRALQPDVALSFADVTGARRTAFGIASIRSAAEPPTGAVLAHRAVDALRFGCGGDALPPVSRGDAYVLARGNCTFAAKAAAAAAAGASALVVYDSLAAAYWTANASAVVSGRTSEWAAGECALDCASGRDFVPAADVTATSALAGFSARPACAACPSGLCALAAEAPTPDASRSLCCFASDLVAPDAGASGGIHVTFLTARDGYALAAALEAPPRAGVALTVARRPTPFMDAGSVALAMLGIAVAALASAHTGEKEGGGGPLAAAAAPPQQQQQHALDVTLVGAGALVLVAAAVLGGLYLLLRVGVPIVYAVIALFALGATSAAAQLVFRPLLRRAWRAGDAPGAWPRCGGTRQGAGEDGGHCTAMGACLRRCAPAVPPSPVALAAAVVAAATVAVYVTCRHEPWAWGLQDALSACLCFAALRVLRVASLRSATLLLCAFFLYDVFMVFITPLFLGGGGVMVDVATAGAPAAYDGSQPLACHCRLTPGDDAVCGPGEVMPILLRVPRVQDYRGGYAMLGLGDVIIPGLALALAWRRDASAPRRRRPADRSSPCWSCYYWPFALAGYAVGVMLANVAAAATSSAQPALLYIVPAVLLPLHAAAAARGEHAAWWTCEEDGSPVPRGGRRGDEEDAGTAPLTASAESTGATATGDGDDAAALLVGAPANAAGRSREREGPT